MPATVLRGPLRVRAFVAQPRDVLLNLAAELALDDVVRLDQPGDAADLVLGELAGSHARVDPGLLQDAERQGRPDAVNVAQRNVDALVAGNVSAGDTWHTR